MLQKSRPYLSGVLFYERCVSSKNLSDAGDQEFRPLAMDLPVNYIRQLGEKVSESDAVGQAKFVESLFQFAA